MSIELSFLKSKVARRILMLFIFCALVPIGALAVISFSQVTDQLYEQSWKRLRESTKAMGMSIFERLTFLENELKVLSSGLDTGSKASMLGATEDYQERLSKRFRGLVFVDGAGKGIPLFGSAANPGAVSEDELKYLHAGKTLLATRPDEDNRIRVYLMRAVDPREPKKGILCGEVNSLYLWGITEQSTLPAMTELCVMDKSGNVIYTSIPLTPSFSKSSEPRMKRSASGRFEWEAGDGEYLAGFWDIFLKPEYLYPQWTVVMSVSKEHILAPMAYFKKIFPLIVLLSLWIVLLLSVIQIRKTMDPLEKLKDGTQQIAMREFDTRVKVNSGDEFEELAGSFNDMARQLGRQFKALTTMAEIDRAVLSALDTEKIVNTAITRLKEFFKYDFVGVTLLNSRSENSPRMYVGTGNQDNVRAVDDVIIMPDEVEKLKAEREIMVTNVGEALPYHLLPFAKGGLTTFVVLPLFIKGELEGIISLGSSDSSPPAQDDLNQARQMADQVAVALSNAQLIEELDLLNWGTLTALARTVDAKSPWTAGHSERVTAQALKIGEVMGLTPDELEDLHRGALLHDIGKIGIPVAVLDKPGKLTDEEYDIIKQHPRIGARIVEPIAAYASVLPMVLQHHEHFNGRGYPDGVSGEELSLGARILAVADVYDALISDRPYRKGMELEKTLSIIKENSGTQFDPNAVEAFLKVVG
ncbi:MAG: HD domain-containing protein [Deltaproteobacteria bacterium]|nr:HD domain-containing protein [Deltaproteobacteria bacterium]MBW2078424.1 HD domain-containing protein [Deltaproteobacteria bacterium]